LLSGLPLEKNNRKNCRVIPLRSEEEEEEVVVVVVVVVRVALGN
jgi:hypothetical protein